MKAEREGTVLVDLWVVYNLVVVHPGEESSLKYFVMRNVGIALVPFKANFEPIKHSMRTSLGHFR